MVLIEGLPYLFPVVYLKVAGVKEILSIPFTEAMAILTDVKYDYQASLDKTREAGHQLYVITGDDEAKKKKEFVVSKEELIKRLQLDIYDNKVKITDMAIQPEDERLVEEVKVLIGV